jgi:heptosyltransferase-2
MQRAEKRSPRILVRGTNWIGDAVMSAPALDRLRTIYPDAHIALLAPPRTAELFEGASCLDEIHPYRRKEQGIGAFFSAVRWVRHGNFDLAVLFQNAFEAALLAFLGGVPRRVGYDAQGRGLLLTEGLRRDGSHRNRHQVYDYLEIVRQCEIGKQERPPEPFPKELLPQWTPRLTASAGQKAAAENLIRKRGLDGAPLVVLNAGATNSRAKCWPADRFARLADRFLDQQRARIVMIGAASERDSAAAVIDSMKHAGAQNLAGETSLAELIGLLDAASMIVSNDTGPAHIAAALGRPTLTLFGPTNEFETAPSGERALLIRADDIECARCMHRECPIDHRCMTRIDPDDVFSRAGNMIEQPF